MTTSTTLRDLPRRGTPGPASPSSAWLTKTRIDHLLALVSSLVLASALFAATRLSGLVGFLIVQFALYTVLLFAISVRTRDRQAAVDRVVTSFVVTASVLTLLPVISIISFVLFKGIEFFRWSFLTDNLADVGPADPATAGGAVHAIIGTFQQVGLATLISVPLGVLTAIYLVEIDGRLAIFKTPVRVIINAMSGLPSIVAGLFIFSVWVVRLDLGYSGFAAALALAMLMLPTIARTTEEMLLIVSPGLREASLALGAPQWRTIFQVVVPTARVGIVTAVILGIARVAGETAPLIMTGFGSDAVNTNPLSGAQSALPLFIFSQYRLGGAPAERAWVGAMVLIVIVLVLFIAARVLGRSQKVGH